MTPYRLVLLFWCSYRNTATAKKKEVRNSRMGLGLPIFRRKLCVYAIKIINQKIEIALNSTDFAYLFFDTLCFVKFAFFSIFFHRTFMGKNSQLNIFVDLLKLDFSIFGNDPKKNSSEISSSILIS